LIERAYRGRQGVYVRPVRGDVTRVLIDGGTVGGDIALGGGDARVELGHAGFGIADPLIECTDGGFHDRQTVFRRGRARAERCQFSPVRRDLAFDGRHAPVEGGDAIRVGSDLGV